MAKIQNYFREVYTELVLKTSWPTRAELQSSAMIVMVASLIIAVIIFGMDISFDYILKNIYSFLLPSN
ncbi:MAG: preprotein translocase subunit SecE [Breznakibacter sp.]|nr:preprotein translocase subunit SecE [Breznakibacter sp.]